MQATLVADTTYRRQSNPRRRATVRKAAVQVRALRSAKIGTCVSRNRRATANVAYQIDDYLAAVVLATIAPQHLSGATSEASGLKLTASFEQLASPSGAHSLSQTRLVYDGICTNARRDITPHFFLRFINKTM